MLITFRKVCTFDWCKRLHQLDVQDSRDQPCLKIQQACKKQKLQVPWVIATFGATFGNFATYIHITYIPIYIYITTTIDIYIYIYYIYVYMLPRCLPIFPPNVCQLRWETDHPRNMTKWLHTKVAWLHTTLCGSTGWVMDELSNHINGHFRSLLIGATYHI